jgi:hypothetical protein
MLIAHAATLLYVFPWHYSPDHQTLALLREGSLVDDQGKLSAAGRKLARQALAAAEAHHLPQTSKQRRAWDACAHENFPRLGEIGDECPACGATYEYLKSQE